MLRPFDAPMRKIPASAFGPAPGFGPALALGLVAGLVLGCRHTYQETIEPTDEQKIELYMTTATYLYEDDDLERAQEQAVKALEVDPENRAMRRMIGWIRLRLGKNEDLIIAERFFTDLVEEGDDNENTHLGLALTCERMGKAYDEVSKALATGERTVEQEQDREAEAKRTAALAREYWKRSLDTLAGLLENGEGSTNAMNALQRVHALAGQFEDSLGWSERLLARTGEELQGWRRMLQEKDLTESEERLFRENERAAVNLQMDTHLFAATLLYRLQRYDEALPHLDAAVDLSPELPQAYSMRGQVRSRVGAYEGAIEDLDRYLALSDAPYESPDIRRAFELRAQCQEHIGSAR